MIPNDQPGRGQMIDMMINHLLHPSQHEDLTSWEQNFITSLRDQFEAKGNLSTKQCEILERLYDK